MEEFSSNLVYAKNVLEFVTVASEYCAFITKTDKYPQKEFLDKSQKLLALLYLKGATLPQFELISDAGNEKHVTEVEWITVSNKTAEKLGKHDHYLEVSSPLMRQGEDYSSVMISEVFADIYQDLMDCISLYRTGMEEIMNDALWECKQNFEQYWGQRLLAALASIHLIMGDEEAFEEEED